MQANKQYSNNGVQYAMYPNPIMNITQSIDGYYSHRGTNAIDDAQADSGISNGYAPCDMVCVATDYGDAYGNAMFWQSTAPVMTRSHGQQYITMMVIHDNTADAYVGLAVSQGQQLFSEGTAGNATGNHNHIEVALGQWTGTHYVASGGVTAWGTTVYMMPGNINPAEVFFVDDTQILNGGDLDWATTGGVTADCSFSTDQLIEEHAKATFTVDCVNAHVNDPNSEFVCRQYNTGDTVEYTYKWVGNGHRYICWYEAENLIMVSVSETEDYNSTRWATIEEIETGATETQPEPVPTPDYTSDVKMYGVDLSEHNSDIDVSQYDYAIIRATWGCADSNDDTSQVDSKFEYWVSECEKNNVPYGVYCYDYALVDASAKQEAEYILSQIKDKNIQMGVWLDMEDADGYKAKNNALTKERCTNSCKIFCDAIKEAGYYTGVYTSTSWLQDYVETDYPLWIANWGTNDGTIQSDQSEKGVMHQYTSTPYDLDVSYHDVSYFANPTKETKPDDNTNQNTDSDNDTTTNDKTTSLLNKLLALLIKILKKVLK